MSKKATPCIPTAAMIEKTSWNYKLQQVPFNLPSEKADNDASALVPSLSSQIK